MAIVGIYVRFLGCHLPRKYADVFFSGKNLLVGDVTVSVYFAQDLLLTTLVMKDDERGIDRYFWCVFNSN